MTTTTHKIICTFQCQKYMINYHTKKTTYKVTSTADKRPYQLIRGGGWRFSATASGRRRPTAPAEAAQVLLLQGNMASDAIGRAAPLRPR
jgi:hypothetical protein